MNTSRLRSLVRRIIVGDAPTNDLSALDLADGIHRDCTVDQPDIPTLLASIDETPIPARLLRDLDLLDLGEQWAPPAKPSAATTPLPVRPIDVTRTLTPGGKALAVQRTERMTALASAVIAAPPIHPERAAAATAYREALKARIAAEREAHELGKSARRTGSDFYALDCARTMLDRRDLTGDTRAYLAGVVLAEYTGVTA